MYFNFIILMLSIFHLEIQVKRLYFSMEFINLLGFISLKTKWKIKTKIRYWKYY